MKELKLFFHRLLDRGYQSNQLTPLFQQAIDNAKAYIQHTALEHLRAKSKKETAHRRLVFLHLPYHPSNPSSKTIQKMGAKRVANPPDQPSLKCLTNEKGYNIPIEQLTIAWHRPPNLGNLLSYWKLNNRTGLKVSAFIKDSNRVCPVFFEQGQATSGGLALCSKITLVVLPPPAAISKTAALGTENSPNCRGKSISPWFFFSEGLSCAPLFFRTYFLCGFKNFSPRQKSNARCLYIFFGAP
jgi:hypothetical protein